jgi:hypothetical protein
MAREVKGRRANKPNDSFGTTNEKSLYRGKYRDDVYKDEEDKQEEQQAQEQDTEQAATPKQDAGDSFAPTQKKETEEKHDFKKRYDDLKRHYDEKVQEFKDTTEDLKAQLNSVKERAYELPRGVQPPKTVEELQEFKERYPDVFEVVETVSGLQAETQVAKLRKEMDEIKGREKELTKQKAYEELLRLHPDFEDIKQDQKFFDWLDTQPVSLSDGIYKNNTDAKLAGRVLDLYKADMNISTKKSTRRDRNTDAAAVITKQQPKEVSAQGKSGKVWKASEIGKLKPWEFERLEKEIDQARSEGRVDFNN